MKITIIRHSDGKKIERDLITVTNDYVITSGIFNEKEEPIRKKHLWRISQEKYLALFKVPFSRAINQV